MKKIFLVLFLFLFLNGTAWSLQIEIDPDPGTWINVGNWDDFIVGTDQLNSDAGSSSDEQLELEWVLAQTGTTNLTYTKYDAGVDDGLPVYDVYDSEQNVSGGYAFDLNGTPDYFLIKWGNGGTASEALEYVVWTLWENNTDDGWAVFNINDPSLAKEGWEIKNIDAFSHYGETVPAPVPEPATILLLGIGLLGLAVTGLKKFQK